MHCGVTLSKVKNFYQPWWLAMDPALDLVHAANELSDEIEVALKNLDFIDDKDLQAIEKKRAEELKKEVKQKEEWTQRGHSEYSEIASEADFFDAVKKSDSFVCHFYRNSTMRCKIVDKHLALLAPKYIEARFCKINAEKSPFLCSRLGISVLPTIIFCKKGIVVHKLIGFTDVGNSDDFTTEELAWVMSKKGVIKYVGKPPKSVSDMFESKRPQFTFQGKQMIKNIRGRDYNSDDTDSD